MSYRKREGDQELPVGNDQPVIHHLVQEDLQKRLELGISRYGQPLQPFNGRDALRDAYEEILDTAVYLKQMIVERDEQARQLQRLTKAAEAVFPRHTDASIEQGIALHKLEGTGA